MKIRALFNNLKIKTKLLALSLATFIFFLALIGIALYDSAAESKSTLQLMEAATRAHYDQQIKDQVQNAVTLLNDVYHRYLLGEITLPQSKRLGADLIRGLRYNGDGYFWVDTTDGTSVVLLGSKAEGTNRYFYRDAKGNPITQIFISNAVSGKDVCVDYWFPKAGETQPVRKRGCAKLFKPFGWVVGTGNYMDDIDREISETEQAQRKATERKMILYAALLAVFGCLTTAAVFAISRSISEPLQKSVDLAGQISDGVMNVKIQDSFKARKDEVGKLSISLEKMQHSICELVTTLREKADALSQEKERLRATLISVGEGVISTDAAGTVALMNPVAEKLTGWPQEEAVGRHIETVFRIIRERSQDEGEIRIRDYFSGGKISLPDGNLVLLSRDGTRVPIENCAAPIFGGDGAVGGAVLVFRDIAEQIKKSEQIQYLGYHDQMTGLYNRTCFEYWMSRIGAPEHQPVSVIMADINGLKLTNDAYGHLAGDKLIEKAAFFLRKGCRQNDLVFRIGGDEFVVLLKKTDLKQAQALVTRIQNGIGAEPDDGTVRLSVAFGCAEKQASTPSMEDVLRQAEDVMYRQKLVMSRTAKLKIIDQIKEHLFSTMQEDHENYPEISRVCREVGKRMGLDGRDLRDLTVAALLHDIGKVTVSREILLKPGPLTPEEWQKIKHQPEAGYHILKSVSQMSQIAEYVLAYHEQWDGNGYPKGLKGKEIPLPSRIICVVDAYYAMVSDRPYRKALSREAALSELEKNAGTQFDPAVVMAFLRKDSLR